MNQQQTTKTKKKVAIARPFHDLFKPARYKIYYGGRGAGKSWAIAQALLIMAVNRKLRILCCREFQTSIADSSHKLLADKIHELGFSAAFKITDNAITGKNGSEFVFKGLARNINNLKSFEGADIVWVEEAQNISNMSLGKLIPTIRKGGSELWLSYNPEFEGAPIEELRARVANSDKITSIVKKVGWQDNPWFTKEMNDERLALLESDPAYYQHVWEGGFFKITEALIFKNYDIIDVPEPDDNVRFFYGADWGYSDPTTLVRAYIRDNELFVTHGLFCHPTLDQIPEYFKRVPNPNRYPIYADASGEMIIKTLQQRGMHILAAPKWPNSVNQGIFFMQSFKKIHIDRRCAELRKEFATYSWKIDKKTENVIPIPEDANNHGIDALRYALHSQIMAYASPKFTQDDVLAALEL